MVSKFIVFATTLAYANAGLLGAPAVATYSAAPSISSSYFHQAAVPVATPIVTKTVAPIVSSYSAPLVSHAAPIATSYAAPIISSYSAGPVASKSVVNTYTSHTAPVVSTYSAPLITKSIAPVVSSYSAHASPVVASYGAYATPVVSSYSAAPIVSKSSQVIHGAPVLTKAVHPVIPGYSTYNAPAVSAYSAPIVSKTIASYAAHAGSTVPYSAAPVAHAYFSGLESSYQW